VMITNSEGVTSESGYAYTYVLVRRDGGWKMILGHGADSDEADPLSPREAAHRFRGSGPPGPIQEAHPSERSDAGGLSHADTVLFEGGLAFFLRMEAPLRWMVWA
jgi:hypothetical protein